MAGSTIVAVTQGLVDFFSGLTGLGDVQVTYAWPGAGKTERKSVWFAEANGDFEQASIRSGRRRRIETIELRTIIEVIGFGKSQEEADTAAIDILTEIETALADDVFADMSDLVEWIIPRRWTRTQGQLDTGHGSRIELTLEVSARIL